MIRGKSELVCYWPRRSRSLRGAGRPAGKVKARIILQSLSLRLGKYKAIICNYQAGLTPFYKL